MIKKTDTYICEHCEQVTYYLPEKCLGCGIGKDEPLFKCSCNEISCDICYPKVDNTNQPVPGFRGIVERHREKQNMLTESIKKIIITESTEGKWWLEINEYNSENAVEIPEAYGKFLCGLRKYI